MKTGLINYTKDMERMSNHIDLDHTNIVIGVAGFQDVNMVASLTLDFLTMVDISEKVRITLPDQRKNDTKIGAVVSMDAATFNEIMTKQFQYEFNTVLLKNIRNLVSGSKDLHFLVDDEKEIKKVGSEEHYGLTENGEYEILQSDVGTLEEKGLSNHEIDVHATVSVKLPNMDIKTKKLRDWKKVILQEDKSDLDISELLRLFKDNGIDI